jgi:hypothetical protein
MVDAPFIYGVKPLLIWHSDAVLKEGVHSINARSRDPAAQQTEAAIGVAVVNRMLAAARPRSVRREAATT